MSDLINRQDAIDALHEEFYYELKDLKMAVDVIKNLPSAQPEIIRCKDCKWKYEHNCTRAVEVFVNDDCYCSWAERRTDE